MSQPTPPAFVQGTKQLLIGGQWVASNTGQHIDAINPANGELLCRIAQGSAQDVDRAVAAARKAFEGPWSRFTAHERRKLLLKVHDAIMDNFEELALIETLDMGAPLARTRGYKEWLSQLLQFYASQTGLAGSSTGTPMSIAPNFMALKHQVPVGVVGGIIPWNGPLMGLWWIYGPALATGCTAVLKPAEDASLSSLRVSELMMEAGVPEGVINVVTGYGKDVGQALSGHMGVDRVAFTGSVGTAQAIVRASAGNLKRLQLELGGKSPDIVFADADLDKAVPGAAMGVFSNTGQVCVAGTRILVQRAIHDEFVQRLAAFAKTIKIGDGRESGVQIGPLISQRQLDRVMHYMDIGGKEAQLVHGGQRLTGGELGKGFFVEPTVFANVRNDMTIAREEIFGPVASVIPFDTVEDALRLANDTPYGLAGGVWTQNLGTAHKVSQGIRSGTVWVNCYGVIDPATGFGGTKMSGYGWKGGKEHVESFLYPKATYFNLD
ncbi:aldehyde dehydrogenase family protein [Alicycliphilus denitrificans]|uniref:4-(hydroxymethyl)benzenesulfonate dehydrogenase n=1 Tax=Alicycliphilus denitrificans TaxID=179636 RepID=A0A3R7HMD4_9BURK|nr:aldehyde dehydrogenase family protein [Alicycliphilus denitrificans]RKJ95068.1 aldehyde dehydrogenase family protein [Alicycliphilus denitrificans]